MIALAVVVAMLLVALVLFAETLAEGWHPGQDDEDP